MTAQATDSLHCVLARCGTTLLLACAFLERTLLPPYPKSEVIMKKNYLLAASALLFCPTLYAAPGCIASNLNGNYVMFQNSVAPANPHIGSCKITILNGLANGNCAFTSQGPTAGFNGPASGTAIINTDCSAKMELDFSPAAGVTVKSYFDMQFSPDKQSFVGQWTNSFGLVGTSAGTRYTPSLPNTPAP